MSKDIIQNKKVSSTTSNVVPWVDKYRPHKLEYIVHQTELMKTLKNSIVTGSLPHLLFHGPPGTGKCLAPETLVMMYDGTFRQAQFIYTGDQLMGDDETPRNVINTTKGVDIMYGVYDNSNQLLYEVNSAHILSLKLIKPYQIKKNLFGTVSLSWFDKGNSQYILANNPKTVYIPKNVDSQGSIIDINIQQYMQKDQNWKKSYGGYRASLLNSWKDIHSIEPYSYGKMIGGTSMIIPDEYKYVCAEDRMKLLIGLSELIGYKTRSIFPTKEYSKKQKFLEEFKSFHETIYINCNSMNGYRTSQRRLNPYRLKNDVIFIARSLGYEVENLKDNIVMIGELSECYEIYIRELPMNHYCGFELDGNRRFVLGDFSVTHNTTTILALAHELFGEIKYKERILELNASDERGISVVRNEIITFSRTVVGTADPNYPCPPFKILILDEADAMTSDAQSALRKVMEETSMITRFCIICNYVDKIIEPIASRCMKFKFQSISDETMTQRLKHISKKEMMLLDDCVYDTITKLVDGDLRRGIMLLQNIKYIYKVVPRVTPNDICDLDGRAPDELVATLLVKCRSVNNKEIIQVAKDCYALGYPVKGLCEQFGILIIHDKTIDDTKKIKLSKELTSSYEQLGNGASELLQLIKVLLYINTLLHLL